MTEHFASYKTRPNYEVATRSARLIAFSIVTEYNRAHRNGVFPMAQIDRLHQEGIWRMALERRGRDWVARELQARFGQPEDEVLDVIFEQPYPTREFCQRWCAEQDNRVFSMSGNTIVIIAAFIFLIAVIARAVVSWDNYRPPEAESLSAGSGPPPRGGDTLQDPSSGPVPSADNGASSSPPQTSISSCTYATYPTAECPSR
jgi:hypothetical protein